MTTKQLGMVLWGWVVVALSYSALSCSTLSSSAVQAAELASGDSSTPASAVTDDEIIKFINEQIAAGWAGSGMSASPKASEYEWIRRVYLDVLGRLPSIAETQAFVGGGNPQTKKADLLRKLLYDDNYVEEYARNWTTVWSNLLVGRPPAVNANRELVNREGMRQFLRASLLREKPYDQMVQEIVSATGSTKPGAPNYNGAVNFLVGKLDENAAQATARTAQYFLGVQVQCTQCHNHPFNDWQQGQFWGMNAFFRQTPIPQSTRQGRDIDYAVLENVDFAGESRRFPQEAEIYYELRNGIQEVAYPTFIDGTTINPSGYVNEVDRRAELAKLIVKSPNLGQAIVNRYWAHFFGYGFTKPIDDMGPHNPPSHPELIERLGREFASRGHDLKKLITWITLSDAYGLSSRSTPRNAKDDPSLGATPMFSHFYVRMMQAEQLYESLLVATRAANQGTYEEQESKKAMWLQQFTITFANDEGDEATTFNGTIPQILMMMNGELIKEATSVESGSFLHQVATSGANAREQIEILYMAGLQRKPTTAELGMASQLLARSGGAVGLQDVWWSLLNSNEFIFIY